MEKAKQKGLGIELQIVLVTVSAETELKLGKETCLPESLIQLLISSRSTLTGTQNV